jgi:uncharacterized membrane protein YccF (DUF307 family)
VASAISGFVAAAQSTRPGFLLTLTVYILVGVSYGIACWRLARVGYLPFPDEA